MKYCSCCNSEIYRGEVFFDLTPYGLGEMVCKECFSDWLREQQIETDPEKFAIKEKISFMTIDSYEDDCYNIAMEERYEDR